MSDRRVAVVGGGLAGITAALRLADAGCAVTLLEARPRLGGLTHSFRRGDLDVDNGQHVFLRCCTAYRALLDRLDVTASTRLQSRLDVPVVRAADGRRARLRRDPMLPAPLHLARSLLGYSVMPVADRIRTGRAVLALRGLDRHDPRADDRSLGDWLAAHGQRRAAVESLWDLLGVATLNLHADDVSLAAAATVFQVGLLTAADAADVGWSTVPLQRLHGDAAAAALATAGADLRLRTKVRALAAYDDGWTVSTDAGAVDVDAVVVATEPATAESLLPATAVDQAPGWAARLGASPIVNVHLVFDRPVLTDPFLAAVGSPVQWIFDRTAASGLADGQYLALSLSAADDVIATPVAELRERLVPEVLRLLPAARGARLRDFFVTREPHATFRAAPGSRRDRPATRTRLPGLVLAGAHTDTDWPATMEGAVRSGDAAAQAVLLMPSRDPEVVPA